MTDNAGKTRSDAERGFGKPDADSQWSRILVFAYLIAVIVPLMWAWFWVVGRGGDELARTTRVTVVLPKDATVAPGPPSFFLDDGKPAELVNRGAIDEAEKVKLLGLLSIDGESVSAPDPRGASYWNAVDRLAFESNDSQVQVTLWILLAGGLTGALGAMARSIGNFVGNASYKPDRDAFDIGRWWPLYGMRPFEGFVLGTVLVLIVQAGLLAVDRPASPSILWWLALAFLAGSGSSEFNVRLRAITKAIFGESADEQPKGTGSEVDGDGTDDVLDQKREDPAV